MALTGWVHLTHPETKGEQLVADSADVVAHLEARGWVRSAEVPAGYDPDAPNVTDAAPAVVDPEAVPAATDTTPTTEAAPAAAVTAKESKRG